MKTTPRSLQFATFTAPAVALALFTAACGNEKQVEPKSANDVAVAPPAPPPARAIPNTPTAAIVAISPDILRACGIAADQAFFAFDSSRVTSTDRSPLDAVARCFTQGPLSGRAMRLVGRADPRGTSDYNMALGLSRADAVAGYLDSRGLTAARTPTTSRGALDATGTDETGWARDRRVDVILAN
jgi:peptidoglycan-associated lipoprotein